MKKTAKNKRKVFVGLSGGVDSSASAALLLEQGYEVVGVFIKVWQPDFIECTWKEERRDAMRVAAHLGIPFLTFDLEAEYKKGVADYMISEYKAGRTPNPDVMCNKEVKFGAFLSKALSMGADYVATGHYAQNIFDEKTETWKMLKGIDTEKDQSYFLWTLDQARLSRILFPVGGLKKPAVRKLAAKFGLPTAAKKDSQGVCFLGKLDMKEFLKHYIKEKKGHVLSMSGEIVGMHDGAVFYTIGERHGFSITKKGANDAPYYIIAKDIQKNTVTVAEHSVETPDGARTELFVEECNWISGMNPPIGKKIKARLRYRQELAACELLSLSGKKAAVHFTLPQLTASPGQSIVFYDGNECVMIRKNVYSLHAFYFIAGYRYHHQAFHRSRARHAYRHRTFLCQEAGRNAHARTRLHGFGTFRHHFTDYFCAIQPRQLSKFRSASHGRASRPRHWLSRYRHDCPAE
jgi:tRNA-specific 2-thiouridylase